MHNPSTSESTRQGKFFKTFHRQLCRDHKGIYALTEERHSFSLERSFKALKHALTTAPLLRPPNYNKDFLLYLAATDSTISTVLVQEDDLFSEYVIYYLSQGLVGLELNSSHIEKLVLAAVHAVQ